jgi:hypothetical protein
MSQINAHLKQVAIIKSAPGQGIGPSIVCSLLLILILVRAVSSSTNRISEFGGISTVGQEHTNVKINSA